MNGMNIVVSRNLPQIEVPYTQIWKAHNIVVCLAKLLKFSPWVHRHSILWEDSMDVFRINGTLYMSQSAFNYLKRNTKEV